MHCKILRHSTKRIVMHSTVDICHHPLDKLPFAAIVLKALISQISEVSKYYSLPFLNYEAAMQSFIETGGNQTLMWSSQSRHPLHSAHAFYADMVMYFCSLAERENGGASQTSTNSDLWYCWWFRNLAFTSWLIGSLSHYLQGFIHPRWLFGIPSINSRKLTEAFMAQKNQNYLTTCTIMVPDCSQIYAFCRVFIMNQTFKERSTFSLKWSLLISYMLGQPCLWERAGSDCWKWV